MWFCVMFMFHDLRECVLNNQRVEHVIFITYWRAKMCLYHVSNFTLAYTFLAAELKFLIILISMKRIAHIRERTMDVVSFYQMSMELKLSTHLLHILTFFVWTRNVNKYIWDVMLWIFHNHFLLYISKSFCLNHKSHQLLNK